MLIQFIGEQIDLSELFSDEGSVPAGQFGVQSITVNGDLDQVDPLNIHTLSRGTTEFNSMRMETRDYGKEYTINVQEEKHNLRTRGKTQSTYKRKDTIYVQEEKHNLRTRGKNQSTYKRNDTSCT
jgi:hypothetical protein